MAPNYCCLIGATAKNWGNKSKKNEGLYEEEGSPLHKVAMALDNAGGAADFEKLEKTIAYQYN